MNLNDEEKAMLAGEAGIVAKIAIEHQIKVGDFFGARDFVPVTQAHVMADTESLGQAGVMWLERLADADEGGVRIPTITDPRGTDFEKASLLGQADWMLELERRTIEAFTRLGVSMTDTCINYQTIMAPGFGEHLAFGDTGVVIYSNSVCGARSNFEGGPSALAAGLTGLEIGSDIGGSIRNPAHYCGVFGLKPTWNLVPMRGHALGGVLTPTDISVIGPMARSAHDLETALHLLAVPDVIEARGLRTDLPTLHEPTHQLRVAVWRNDALCPVSAAVQARIDAVAQALAGQGATVDDQARPGFAAAHSHAVFQGLLHAAMSVRFPDAEYAQLVAQADALDAADQSPAAQLLRAQTMRARDWQRLNEARTQIRWAWHRFFEQFDVLIAPVMSTTAFAHDHGPFGQRSIVVDGQPQPYFSQIFWAGLAGVAQLPAVVVPGGQAADGLPVGVQLIGPAYGDLRLVQLAQRLEALGFGFTPPPGL